MAIQQPVSHGVHFPGRFCRNSGGNTACITPKLSENERIEHVSLSGIFEMNQNDVKFGIEIECFIPSAKWGSRPVGGYHNGLQITDLPAGWKAERDGSLATTKRNRIAVEIVSPILSGADGVRQIKIVCNWLATMGAEVNESCGFHVTVGVPSEINTVRRLVHSAARHEKALYAVTGTRRREMSRFAAPMKSAFRALEGIKTTSEMRNCPSVANRYYALNLTHVLRGSDRIEFRAFAGTTNVLKILGYVQLCVGLAFKAMASRKTPKWDLNPKSVRQGAGKKALFCLTRFLQWSESKLTGTGVIDSETLPAVMAELKRLATKYDTPVG